MAQRTHLLIGLPLGPSAACPSKPFFGVLPLYRTVKDQERHSIIFSQVSLTAVSLGIQVRSSWDSATLFFVSKHLIDKTCTESCSKNGAESPWSANGRGNWDGWAKSRECHGSGHFLICGDSFWLLQKIVKSESLQDMLSKISAWYKHRNHWCGRSTQTSPAFTTLWPSSFKAIGALILKGAGDCSLPKNFLTRSLCTFPGVSPQEPSCAKECISLLSQPGFTAHSTVCNLLDFTSTQLSCCKFPQEKQP